MLMFTKVQQTLDAEATALISLVEAELGETPEYTQSLRAALELEGAYAFGELRALHGDEVRFDYRDHAWNNMITELGRRIDAFDDRAPCTATRKPGSDRSFEERVARRLRRLHARERVASRRGYFASEDDLVKAALEVARLRVRGDTVKWVSQRDPSLGREDLLQRVAMAAKQRCNSYWRPEKGPLRQFLCAQVGFAFLDELKQIKRSAERHDEIVEQQKGQLKQELRDGASRDWQRNLADERQLHQQEKRYAEAKDLLPAEQQAEVERELGFTESGRKRGRTEAQRARLRRAKGNIRRYYDEHPIDDPE